MHYIFCFKQKTAYEMRISDWSSDVCSSDLGAAQFGSAGAVDRLRTYVDLPDGNKPFAVALAATDPANPFGAALAWPERTTEEAEIGRASCRERVCQYV